MMANTFKTSCYLLFIRTDISFGICTDEVAKVLAEVVSVFGWTAVEQFLRKIIETTSTSEYHHVITFIANCPSSVPKEELFNSIIEAISKQSKNSRQLSSLGIAVLKSRKQCPQFVDLFFKFNGVNNLAVLANIIPSFEEREMKVKDVKTHRYYRLICSKMLAQLDKIPEDCHITSDNDAEAIINAAQFMLKIEDNDNMLKFVNGILPKASHNLMKKLANSMCQSPRRFSFTKAVKMIFEARIAQLKPIVAAGVQDIGFRKPHVSIPDHPDVEEFLKGPDQTYKYSNFACKEEAQDFKQIYFVGQRLANVRIVCTRGEVGVVITKLPADVKRQQKEYQDVRGELDRLEMMVESQRMKNL